MSELLKRPPRPDYRYRYKGESHPGYYNRDVTFYDVMVAGKYFCTISLTTSDHLLIEAGEFTICDMIITRCLEKYPGLRHYLGKRDITHRPMRITWPIIYGR